MLVGWLDRLVVWLIDWLIGCLVGLGWLAGWLDCLVVWLGLLVGWLVVWLGWLIVRLGWLVGWVVWFSGWLGWLGSIVGRDHGWSPRFGALLFFQFCSFLLDLFYRNLALSAITFTQEHWTADIGAGSPGFLSFEAFHSFCGFQSFCFTEHDICISKVYSNEAVPGGIRSIDSTN